MSQSKQQTANITLRATAASAVENAQENVLGAEKSRLNVESALGAPGTYDLPNGLGLNGTGASPITNDNEGLIKTNKAKSFWATQALEGRPENVQNITTLDSDAVSKKIQGSAEFRIRSRMTAESEQLLARQGDLYDRMIKNQLTPVSEALGAAQRESMQETKQMMQRGGAARRTAMAMDAQLREKEKFASEKATQISNIYQKTDEFARKYATDTLAGNQAWVGNLGGIRDDYTKMANSVQAMLLNSALPLMSQLENKQHELRAQASAEKREKSMRIVKLGVAAVATYFGGPMAGMAAYNAMGSATSSSGGSSSSSGGGFNLGGAMSAGASIYEGYQNTGAGGYFFGDSSTGKTNNIGTGGA